MPSAVSERLLLVKQRLRDERTPRRHKLALLFLLAYLACPIDLIPDFIPVLGQLDDVIIAALVFRYVLREEETEGDAILQR
jgi:uncharacterized membrane protein YkvA (DUF1232 family)